MVTLAAAIQSLRDELAEASAAIAADGDAGIRLTVDEAEIELELELAQELRGGVEVNVWFVKIGADGGGSTARSHRVRLKLKVSGPTGPLDVNSTDQLPTPPPPAGRT